MAVGRKKTFFDMEVAGGASASGNAGVEKESLSPSYPDPDTTNNVVTWSLISSS